MEHKFAKVWFAKLQSHFFDKRSNSKDWNKIWRDCGNFKQGFMDKLRLEGPCLMRLLVLGKIRRSQKSH